MNISFITGTRADFGKIEPVISELISRGHKISIFATGMHHFQEFGLTLLEVQNKFGDRVFPFVNQELEDPHEQVFIKTIHGLIEFYSKYAPELVFVHGDRIEAFAACSFFAMRQVFVAHIEGGEISGTIDEVYRHCNTKLSAIHFVSSTQAAKRIRLMGEEPDRIFCTGSPELDLHMSKNRPPLEEVKEHYGIKFANYGILIFHPVVSEIEDIKRQAEEIVFQLIKTGHQFIVIKPNNDPGFLNVVSAYKNLPNKNFKVIPSIRFQYFSKLLENAKIVVGNSSLGVREAPFFGVPSIDIGTRQTNRASAESVKLLNVLNLSVLGEITNSQWGKSYERDLSFGDGNASRKIADVVDSDILLSIPKQKFYRDSRS